MDNPAPLLCVGVDVSGVELEKRDEYLAMLNAYPPASQAYTATATYDSMACRKLFDNNDNSCNAYSVSYAFTVQGQFEDAE